MITPEYCQTMASYNAWQNNGLREVIETLSEDDLRKGRGAFFGSIFGTLNHLLWGDMAWMSRIDGGESPGHDIRKSVDCTATSAEWAEQRMRMDARIQLWAQGLNPADLTGEITWFSGSMNAEVSHPRATCITHFFNHQTHHRGQIHAMLTAAGLSLQATDLVFMPDSYGFSADLKG